MFALHVIRSTQASRKLLILVVESIASTSVLVLLRNKQSSRQNLKMRHGYSLWCIFYDCHIWWSNHQQSIQKLYFAVHIVDPW
jgi:hypothetical protein